VPILNDKMRDLENNLMDTVGFSRCLRSAGIGRTGTFMVIDIFINEFKSRGFSASPINCILSVNYKRRTCVIVNFRLSSLSVAFCLCSLLCDSKKRVPFHVTKVLPALIIFCKLYRPIWLYYIEEVMHFQYARYGFI